MPRLFATLLASAVAAVVFAAPVPKGNPTPEYFPTRVGTKTLDSSHEQQK